TISLTSAYLSFTISKSSPSEAIRPPGPIGAASTGTGVPVTTAGVALCAGILINARGVTCAADAPAGIRKLSAASASDTRKRNIAGQLERGPANRLAEAAPAPLVAGNASCGDRSRQSRSDLGCPSCIIDVLRERAAEAHPAWIHGDVHLQNHPGLKHAVIVDDERVMVEMEARWRGL